MLVKEVFCKSILSKSRLGTDYSINPYRGCAHACEYCYAPYILREKRKWGDFIEVKINAPEVLEKDLKKHKPGSIFISSVTDPYNPLEKKYKLTRRILEKLKNTKFSISIQTKSNLVLRDIDLLKELDCEVGMTITTFNEESRKIFEPNASSSEKRLEALKILRENGIKTYVFFGPVLPLISDENLKETIKKFVSVKPDYIYIDKLNIKGSLHWRKIKNILEKNYPELVKRWEKILFSENDYYQKIKSRIIKICKNINLKYEFCY